MISSISTSSCSCSSSWGWFVVEVVRGVVTGTEDIGQVWTQYRMWRLPSCPGWPMLLPVF